jgi:hypothetical protein
MGEVCPVFHNVSSSTPETDLNAMHLEAVVALASIGSNYA